jgi:hypothetical protein
MKPFRPAILSILLVFALPGVTSGDAIIRTQAMLAGTIAEFFIEEGRIRVELEVGLDDLLAFRNLLPDEVYEGMGNQPHPLRERMPAFFQEDLVISAGDTPLSGRVVEIGPRVRVKRDEVTGEPLPSDEGEEEIVVFVRLEYELTGHPESLAIRGPRSATAIGFVAYHQGIPINDFRYLVPAQSLELDWSDPWYSRFRSRNLRRTYYEPMSAFIYVEPYEVRKEIIVRPRDLEHWIDLGLEGRDTIPVEIQAELKQRVASFLREHQPVEIDGKQVEPELARINFLDRTLNASRVIEPPVELNAYAAILGAIFVYPTDGLPTRVDMVWDLWSDRIQRVPAASVDQAGPLPVYLEPDHEVLEWENFLKNPELPTLRVLQPPPSVLPDWIHRIRWFVLLATLGVSAWWLRSPRKRLLAWGTAWILVAACFWSTRGAPEFGERAAGVTSDLLHNIYRAFDFRDEEKIYDTLAQSVQGELLVQTYLEARSGLELANQGGARVKVKEIDLIEFDAQPSREGGFSATATWNVAGSVGHWGHVHQRRNQYRAEMEVAPVDGVWKLVALEILNEERI